MANEQSHTEKFEQLCAGYVLHALDREEREEFEEMLGEASAEERDLYQTMWTTANQLAFTVEQEEPPADLKERLMEIIREQQQDQNDNTVTNIDEGSPSDDKDRFNWSALGVAASFALLIVSLSLIFYSFNLNSSLSNKNNIIAEKNTQITQLKNELERKEEMLSILEARDVDLVMMAGRDVNPNGYGKVIWNASKQQALLQVSNLPTEASDKDYQLWLIKNNKPVSAGVFSVGNQNDAFFKIEQMAEADKQSTNAFAITLEPKGGVSQPTGDVYLLGNVGNK
ncbi:Anti-sigma-K factor RskA [Fodinibius salinus]|uniref:Regulator of SigK n=1 Tax=Fodinibius salinus TaxID=860790 RepID=A0A5D3YIL4_9BACT|nr:anti-sigma factor [Fodinibius salinus]TYP92575.1 Anti-sigma-K factor RskA [Fodinibius salinus]